MKEEKQMAIFHLSVKMISRGKGKSAVAASAYRSGEKITSDYDGITHDYTRKRGIAKTLIMLPDNAPLEFYNRSTLWTRGLLQIYVFTIKKTAIPMHT